MLDLRLRWLKLPLINEPTTTTRLDMVTIILISTGSFFCSVFRASIGALLFCFILLNIILCTSDN